MSCSLALFSLVKGGRTHPARRLGKAKYTDECTNGEEDLESEGEAELRFVVDVAHAVVYPVRCHYAEDVDH